MAFGPSLGVWVMLDLTNDVERAFGPRQRDQRDKRQTRHLFSLFPWVEASRQKEARRGHSSSAHLATQFSFLVAMVGHSDGSSTQSGCSNPIGVR